MQDALGTWPPLRRRCRRRQALIFHPGGDLRGVDGALRRIAPSHHVPSLRPREPRREWARRRLPFVNLVARKQSARVSRQPRFDFQSARGGASPPLVFAGFSLFKSAQVDPRNQRAHCLPSRSFFAALYGPHAPLGLGAAAARRRPAAQHSARHSSRIRNCRSQHIPKSRRRCFFILNSQLSGSQMKS